MRVSNGVEVLFPRPQCCVEEKGLWRDQTMWSLSRIMRSHIFRSDSMRVSGLRLVGDGGKRGFFILRSSHLWVQVGGDELVGPHVTEECVC